MEHDILRVGVPVSRIAKITKGHRFGFYPHADPTLVSGMVSDWFGLRPGTPLQYLRRMALTHELFPASDHRLEGFAILDGQFRIVISQRFVDPVPASAKAIAEFFTESGFVRLLPEAWYRAADNVAIFDTGTTNVLEFAGRLFPIDIMPIRPAGIMLARIREALQVPFSRR
jgi:Serine/Threonine/Tyrosine Kinase found in polyvalent proteins